MILVKFNLQNCLSLTTGWYPSKLLENHQDSKLSKGAFWIKNFDCDLSERLTDLVLYNNQRELILTGQIGNMML